MKQGKHKDKMWSIFTQAQLGVPLSEQNLVIVFYQMKSYCLFNFTIADYIISLFNQFSSIFSHILHAEACRLQRMHTTAI